MIRRAAWILFLGAVLTGPSFRAAADEVVTGVVREGALDLGGTWHYKAVSQVGDSLFAPATDDAAWPTTHAPARWADQKINTEGAPAVVYRRSVKVPAQWQGRQIGISAWFCAGDSLVYVNGQEVDPDGPPNALYADVSSLLHYGEDNLIAVSTTVDGVRELAESDPPLLGPLGQKRMTRVVRAEVSIPTHAQPLRANLFMPEGGEKLPMVVFSATGHADYSLKDDWRQLNEDLARLGYASLAVAFNRFTPQEFEAVFRYIGGLTGVDRSRIALVGAMKAARPVVLAAIGNPDVRTVVLISSARIAEVAQLGERPVLFICGDKEASVPALSAAREMTGMLVGPHDIASLPAAVSGVALLDTSWNGLRAALLGWLGKYLGGRS